MSATSDRQDPYTPRDHVLGRIPERVQDAADERSITDPVYYEDLVAEEELLIEEYARGRLSTKDAQAFEAVCLVRGDIRERLACERALRQDLGSRVPQPIAPKRRRIVAIDRWRAITAVAASVALLLAGVTLYLNHQLSQVRAIAEVREREWQQRDIKQRETIATVEQQRQPQAPAQVQPQPKASPDSTSGRSRQLAPILASLIIPPTTRGDSSLPRFTIPDGAGRVQLHFNIGGDTSFSSYRVVVTAQRSDVSNTVVKSHVVNRFPVVSVILPVTSAAEQSYQASVYGVAAGQDDELLEAYSFMLVRQ